MITEERLMKLRGDIALYESYYRRKEDLEQMRVTAVYGSDPHGGGMPHDEVGERVAKLDALKNKISAKLIDIEKERLYIETSFDRLPEQQRMVMYYRYLEGMSWRDVANKLHYSVDHCRGYIRQHALERLMKMD